MSKELRTELGEPVKLISSMMAAAKQVGEVGEAVEDVEDVEELREEVEGTPVKEDMEELREEEEETVEELVVDVVMVEVEGDGRRGMVAR
jgi:hypothetical protein